MKRTRQIITAAVGLFDAKLDLPSRPASPASCSATLRPWPAHHMGAGMSHMLEKMGLTVQLGETGTAKDVAARLLGSEPDT